MPFQGYTSQSQNFKQCSKPDTRYKITSPKKWNELHTKKGFCAELFQFIFIYAADVSYLFRLHNRSSQWRCFACSAAARKLKIDMLPGS